MTWTRIRTQLGRRGAIAVAGVAGFVLGAGGFAAAQSDDPPAVEAEPAAGVDGSVAVRPSTSAGITVPDSSVATAIVDLSVPAVSVATTDAGPSSTVHAAGSSSVPQTTIDDSSSVPDTVDDSSSTSSVPDTVDDSSSTSSVPDTVDDSSSTSSVPDTVDDSSSTSSVPAALPAAYTRSYQSFGGSIDVTWTGTAFVLDSVSPARGFRAEIEDLAWDRVRVDFEGADADARIEVRLDHGQIRVRVD